MQFDDSDLLHGKVYDATKAREYYLRTRQLKGRKSGTIDPLAKRQNNKSATVKTPRKSSEARRKEIQAQQAALEKRLDTLKIVLKRLVEKAKSRSGVEEVEKKEKKDSVSNNGKRQTAAQKREASERAKKAYEKVNASPEKKVAALKEELKDIRAKIQEALDDAKKPSKKTKPKSETATKGR